MTQTTTLPTRRHDERDLIIEELAANEAAQTTEIKTLRLRVADLEADGGVYREIAHQLLGGVHDLTVRYDRLHANRSRMRRP